MEADLPIHALDVEGQPGFVLTPILVGVHGDAGFHLIQALAGAGGGQHGGIEILEIAPVGNQVGLELVAEDSVKMADSMTADVACGRQGDLIPDLGLSGSASALYLYL